MVKGLSGKELILAAMRNEETPRPAWLPFVGVHGGKLIGKSATEYLQSADCIVEGWRKPGNCTGPTGCRSCSICRWRRKCWAHPQWPTRPPSVTRIR